MTRTLVALAVFLLVFAAFVPAEQDQKEYVSSGEVIAVSVENNTVKVREIAEPPKDALPGTMQSGVVREFTITPDTKFMMPEAQSGSLANIRVGDRVTIHFTLGTGKNVATRITQGRPATE